MGRNRRNHPRGRAGVHHRPARREGVGRRSRGRGHNQAIGTLVGQKAPINLDAQLQHACGRAAIDHHIVYRQGFKHAVALAHHAGVHERAHVFVVFTQQNRKQRFAVTAQGDVGHKAQAPLVDAHQRRAVLGQMAADAQHGAIAPHHHRQSAVLAQFIDRQRRKALVQPGVQGGIRFHHHLAAFGVQELGNLGQRLVRRVGRGAVARQLVVLADQGNMAECGT